ncbi:MAG TPA: HupE/UreJ family protein [Chitinophagales bacterium]|nr:HupE/UreJ family protein [Chitinophagales bacterium]
MKLFNHSSFQLKFIFLSAIILLAGVASCFAHTLNYDFSKMSRTDIGWVYLKLGYQHIIPLGIDHILFITSIFLLSPSLKKVIWQATAFTLAHSITLALAMYGVIKPVSAIIEPVIALSIVLVAMENLITQKLHPWRVLIIFCFGLVHGMGFASALVGLGLPENQFLVAIITFNLGVELGQISVILLAFMLVGIWFGKKPWYHARIVVPASAIIAMIALYWTIERTAASLHALN